MDLSRVEIPAPSIGTQQKVVDILDRFDTLTKSLTDGIPAEIGVRRAQYGYYRDRLLDFPRKAGRHAQHALDLGRRLDVGVDVERDHGVSLYAERLYKPPWRATIRALPKNMRKIEGRLSLPNRSNGTEKALENSPFRGALMARRRVLGR